jgi:trans-aconitate 2-methyltransferase
VPKWDPQQYLQFERERSQPCRDLVSRIVGSPPSTIIDLGCGTGTSTAILRERWPSARITGLDSSSEMIAVARAGDTSVEWVAGDLRHWAPAAPFDLVFSNAALHWVPDHGELVPRLLRYLSPGGVLAVQMPVNSESPAHRYIREVANRPSWAARWGSLPAPPAVGSVEFYYTLLAPHCSEVELWVTEYVHVVPDGAAILEWVKGTTLRPYLDRLPVPQGRERFLAEILRGVIDAYPPQTDGRVLFPFRRLFFVARRN